MRRVAGMVWSGTVRIGRLEVTGVSTPEFWWPERCRGDLMSVERRAAVGPGFGEAVLLERDGEISRINAALDGALAGGGTFLIVEGSPGIGKSSLAHVARVAARQRGMMVLTARGAELEREYPYGIVRTLFEAVAASAAGQEALASEPTSRARPAIDPRATTPPTHAAEAFPILNGLYWFVVTLAEQNPTLLVIDDAQWADAQSLDAIHYIVQRIESLPVVMFVAKRTIEQYPDERLARLRAHDDAVVLQPSPLSLDAVKRLASRTGATDTRAQAVWEATGGNPFYISELLRDGTQVPDGSPASSLPDAVARAVMARLTALGPEAVRLAEAIAVLDEEATLQRAAGLARIPSDDAPNVFRALVSAAILGSYEIPRFVHSIVREAVQASMTEAVAGHEQGRAAELLAAEDASLELVAIHLLVAERTGDPAVVGQLRAAAADAAARGAPQAAVTYLRRALDELPPQASERVEVLLELARAEAVSVPQDAPVHFSEALTQIDHPRERAAVLCDLGQALMALARWPEATAAFEEGLSLVSGEPRDPLIDRLEVGFVSSGWLDRSRHDEAEERLGSIIGSPTITAEQRELALWTAFRLSAAAEVDLTEALTITRHALGSAPPEEISASGQSYELAAAVFLCADEIDAEVTLLDAAIDVATRSGSLPKFAVASYCRSMPNYYAGRLPDAIADARAAVDAQSDGWETFYCAARGILAMALLESGEVEAAWEAARLDPRWRERVEYYYIVPLALARLHLAAGDAAASLRAVEDGVETTVSHGIQNAGFSTWRLEASLAHLALGQRERAVELAEEAVDIQRRWGAARPLGMTLRVLGLAVGGIDGLNRLRESVAVLSHSPSHLERARALVELGAALRRERHAAEARDILRRGMDLAHRCGAHPLVTRAREELLATGDRPRRYRLTGIEALTPAELRVSRLAADGRTNREVAQSLFVTPKAVEFHLGNAYRKLQISSRAELPGALDPSAELASV